MLGERGGGGGGWDGVILTRGVVALSGVLSCPEAAKGTPSGVGINVLSDGTDSSF